MGLSDVYRTAIQDHYEFPKGWLPMWPPGLDHPLGAVGRVDDGKFNQNAVLADKGIEVSEDPDHGTTDGPWDFSSDHSISVKFGVDGKLPEWNWIGAAKAGVKIAFGKSEGVVVGVGTADQRRFGNIDGLKEDLLDAAHQKRLARGDCVIVEQHVANTGLVVASEGGNAEFSATTSANIGAPGVPQTLASFAADLAVQSASSTVAHNSYPGGFVIASRIVKVGQKGFLWWKELRIEGVTPVDEEQAIAVEEELATPDDYFAVFSGVTVGGRT